MLQLRLRQDVNRRGSNYFRICDSQLAFLGTQGVQGPAQLSPMRLIEQVRLKRSDQLRYDAVCYRHREVSQRDQTRCEQQQQAGSDCLFAPEVVL